MRRAQGFTLIELIIAIAIIGILMGIVLPSYRTYVLRGRVSEALAGLSAGAAGMERWFQDNRSYNDPNNATGCPLGIAFPTSQNFTFACSPAPTASSYAIQATGRASMLNFQYQVDQAGNHTTVSLPSGWTGAGSNCWVIKPDGSC